MEYNKTIIQLAHNQIGWFDELTGIHLTIVKKQATIQEGMNTTNIKRAIKNNIIELVSGSL